MKPLSKLGLLLAFCCFPAKPISLSFLPTSQTVLPGQFVNVDVLISGLARPPAVGAFDLDVSFAPGILSPTGITFGPFLGNLGAMEALSSFSFSPGVFEFAEVSLLSDTQLNALQPANFSLATLSFMAIGC